MEVAILVNAEADNEQLVQRVEEARTNLGKMDQKTADGGFASTAQLGRPETRGYEVPAALDRDGAKRAEQGRRHFANICERVEVVCPRGKRGTVGVYRSPVHAQCPARELCSPSKNGRSIERSAQ